MAGRTARRAWLVVAACFATLFFVFGSGYNTAGVFVTPLVGEFGWSRVQVSMLQTTVALAAGLVVPIAGWLLDRIEARIVMVAGAAVAGAGFLLASRAGGLGTMVTAYAVVGAGLGASTLLPVPVVVANWFHERRGLALGLAMSGTSTGGMVMTIVADRTVRAGGWRLGYLVLAIPIVAVVLPAIVALVRTRPPGASRDVAAAARALPGLEVADAVRMRSFWLIGVAQLAFAFAASGTNLHAIPYFIASGWAPARAALCMSLVLGIAGAGKLLMGALADRVGSRWALATNSALCAVGTTALLFAGTTGGMAAFVAVYGLTIGAPLTLVPLLTADALGLRRFGSLAGLIGLFNVSGAALGPVVAGRTIDVTQGYARAFELAAVAHLLAAVAAIGCRSLRERDAREGFTVSARVTSGRADTASGAA